MEQGCALGETGIGRIAVHWQSDGQLWRLVGIDLPPASAHRRSCGQHDQADRLLARLADPRRRSGHVWALRAAQHSLTDFAWAVLETLAATVPAGRVVSYGGLAELVGRPGAARAVGTVMSKNPFPLLIPCHRVIASGGRIGGFQGNQRGAIERKHALLVEEGVRMLGSRRVAPEAMLA